jgi:hypothetical protein
MKDFYDLLIELNACDSAINWSGNKPIEQVVKECHRGDWMLWLAYKVGVDKRKLTLAKALCAKTVIHLMEDDRSKKFVEVAENYGNGLATDEELVDAAYEADIVISKIDTGDVTNNYAAHAAAHAAASMNNNTGAIASSAATAVGTAAADDATDVDTAATAAIQENQLKTADICREVLGDIIIQKVNELLNK